MNTMPFRLLDLAAELRNNVYEKHLEDIEVRLSNTRSRHSLIIRSPLLAVNRHLRDEFKSLASKTATIVTSVTDYNFAHVIAFLNQRFEPAAQTMMIQLGFKSMAARERWNPLKYWLKGFEGAKHKSLSIKFEYEPSHTCFLDCHITDDWPPLRFHYSSALYEHGPDFPRMRAEAKKIQNALASWYLGYDFPELADDQEQAYRTDRDRRNKVQLRLEALRGYRAFWQVGDHEWMGDDEDGGDELSFEEDAADSEEDCDFDSDQEEDDEPTIGHVAGWVWADLEQEIDGDKGFEPYPYYWTAPEEMDDEEIEEELYDIELRRLELEQEQEARQRERESTTSEGKEDGREA